MKYRINEIDSVPYTGVKVSSNPLVPAGFIGKAKDGIIKAPPLVDEDIKEASPEEFALACADIGVRPSDLAMEIAQLDLSPAEKTKLLMMANDGAPNAMDALDSKDTFEDALSGGVMAVKQWKSRNSAKPATLEDSNFTPNKYPNANGNRILSMKERLEMKITISHHFGQILRAMGFNPEDQNLQDTPNRVAKMFVDEIFSGCFNEPPKMTTFDASTQDMVYLGDIDFTSACSHHFVFFSGRGYIAYIPNKKLIGISKLARVLDWFAKRPQIQEELSNQVADFLMKALETPHIGVHLEASHGCMTARGVQKSNAVMKTTALRGSFKTAEVKDEFLRKISDDKRY